MHSVVDLSIILSLSGHATGKCQTALSQNLTPWHLRQPEFSTGRQYILYRGTHSDSACIQYLKEPSEVAHQCLHELLQQPCPTHHG